MNRSEAKALIEKLVAAHQSGMKARQDAAKAIGCQPENPLFDAMWTMEQVAMESVSMLLGDRFDWIMWFLWENDCGARGHECGVDDGKLEKICNVDDLLRVIGFPNVKGD